MNYACAANYNCYGPINSISQSNELINVLIFMYVDAFILFVLFLYLEAVLPKQYGVPKHPLFFLKKIYELFMKIKKKIISTKNLKTNDSLISKKNSSDMITGRSEDSDVLEERKKVYHGEWKKDLDKYPLIINDLFKDFGNHKIAVNKLCLSVTEGECFGLLGENGAGKTTTISICTGLIKPTKGFALVGGFDIRNEIDKVHLVIGVCPQFSILWETLTVEEHLLFYARLKGISPTEEKLHVKQSLQKFGLFDSSKRLAINLSGGMQRRLSIAIALIGDSEICFLDEPTTGLDPASRHQIWKLINNAKVGRALILTTHSMEEAELLSSRIGIMVSGELQCLGSPLHLKNKFANGYCLNINFAVEDKKVASESIKKLFPDAKEVADFKTTKEYRITVSNGKISQVFATMEANALSSKITDWSITQVGLEDVFQKIVQQSKHPLVDLKVN